MKRMAGVGLVGLVLVAAACGGDDEGSGTEAPPAAASADTSAGERPAATAAATTAATFPVTIEHAFGATTFDAPPERIVTLGAQWTDVLLALGVQPIAHVEEPLAGETGIYPWQEGLLDGSTGLTVASADDLPFEQLAALRPDAILVTYYAEDETVYDRLAAIAPTIGMLGERQVDTWQDLITVAGQIVGKPEQAAAATEEVAQLVAATAAEYPGLRGRTFVMANFIPGDSIYVVADPDDGSSVFFQDLGMTLDPDVQAAADGVSGRATFSFEQTALLDGDLLVAFSNGEDPSSFVGYDDLEVVERGASAELEFADVVGLNTPTPLSIPYVLEIIRPQLAAAAGGGS